MLRSFEIKYLFPLFIKWHACKLVKLSACGAKCMTTINMIYILHLHVVPKPLFQPLKGTTSISVLFMRESPPRGTYPPPNYNSVVQLHRRKVVSPFMFTKQKVFRINVVLAGLFSFRFCGESIIKEINLMWFVLSDRKRHFSADTFNVLFV